MQEAQKLCVMMLKLSLSAQTALGCVGQDKCVITATALLRLVLGERPEIKVTQSSSPGLLLLSHALVLLVFISFFPPTLGQGDGKVQSYLLCVQVTQKVKQGLPTLFTDKTSQSSPFLNRLPYNRAAAQLCFFRF